MSFTTIDYGFIINFGIAGAMLGWFMFRLEKKLESLTSAINGCSLKNPKKSKALLDN